MAFPLTHIFVEQYKAAAAEGAVVELQLRLLADKIPALQQFAHEQILKNVEAAIAKHFGAALSDTEKETLRLCRELRNKILHCDFRVARNKLEELGGKSQHGGVKEIAVHGLTGAQVAEKLTSAKADVEGTFQYVADTKTTDPGNVFGWLLEMGNAGDFQQAANAFKGAAAIVDRLLTANTGNIERSGT